MSDKATDFKTLRELAIKIHNQRVKEAYGSFEGEEWETKEASDFLLSSMSIAKSDTMERLLIKMMLFYFGCSRFHGVSSTPTLWNTKADKYKPQLQINFQPEERRRLKYNKYDPDSQLHLPHYDPAKGTPKIPSYIVGMQSAKLILKDGSYLLVNAKTEDMAIKFVAQLAEYVNDKQIPSGGILENITTTRRKGKRIDLYGRKIVPKKVAYFEGGKEGMSPNFILDVNPAYDIN